MNTTRVIRSLGIVILIGLPSLALIEYYRVTNEMKHHPGFNSNGDDLHLHDSYYIVWDITIFQMVIVCILLAFSVACVWVPERLSRMFGLKNNVV